MCGNTVDIKYALISKLGASHFSSNPTLCFFHLSLPFITLTPASPAEARQSFCSILLHTLLFPPPSQAFQIPTPNLKRSPLPHCPVTIRAMHTHTQP